MTELDAVSQRTLLRWGLRLEYATLLWNVVSVVVLILLAARAGSPALTGFGFDSLIEISASVVVVWQLSGASPERERRAMRLIGLAFVALVVFLVAQIVVALALGVHPAASPWGIAWTSLTFFVMIALAIGKVRTGSRLGNPVLQAEGRVTLVDAGLAAAVVIGLLLNLRLSWWWADSLAGVVIAFYAAREAVHALMPEKA